MNAMQHQILEAENLVAYVLWKIGTDPETPVATQREAERLFGDRKWTSKVAGQYLIGPSKGLPPIEARLLPNGRD